MNRFSIPSLRFLCGRLLPGAALLSALLLSACREEEIAPDTDLSAGLTIAVSGHAIPATRAAVTEYAENKVRNLYVFVFKADGACENRYFAEEGALHATMLSEKPHYRISLDNLTAGEKQVVVVANIREGGNKTRFSLTKEMLENINTLDDLKALSAGAEASALFSPGEDETFLMVSEPKTITLNCGAANSETTILLDRVTAKVKFVLNTKDSPNFIPTGWKVVNLPTETRVMKPATTSHRHTGDYADASEENAPERRWEGTGYGDEFTFYLCENMLKGKAVIPYSDKTAAYRERARRNKTPNPDGSKTNGTFKYAPDHGTYVVIRGTYADSVNTDEGKKQATAEMTLTIPLGYTSPTDTQNDFFTERNTFYTYTVTVKGVDNIYVEAVKRDLPDDGERDPGVEGKVIALSDMTFRLDAHYEQRLFTIVKREFEQLDINKFYFMVSTPYGTRQCSFQELMETPRKQNAEEFVKLSSWLEFRQNRMDAGDYLTYFSASPEGYYYYLDYWHANRVNRYPKKDMALDTKTGGNRLRDVVDFMKLLQKNWNWCHNIGGSYPQKYLDYPDGNIFENPADAENQYHDEPKAYFTVYANENYYEQHPLDPAKPVHWSEFCNTPPREFYIFTKKETSVDGQSVFIDEPLLHITQLPIYTVFLKGETGQVNVYGMESINETGGVQIDNDSPVRRQYDYYTGRRNTVLFKDWSSWSWYHEWWEPQGDYGPEYSICYDGYVDNPWEACIFRNRDLNQNDIIEHEEMRWYVPAIGQLVDMALGEAALPEKARLYRPDDYKDPHWPRQTENKRQHHWYISSTRSDYKSAPYWLWSDEGFSTSGAFDWDYDNYSDKGKEFNLRCFRDLGKVTRKIGSDGRLEEDMQWNQRPVLSTTPNWEEFTLIPAYIDPHGLRTPDLFIEEGEMEPHMSQSLSARPYAQFYFAKNVLCDGDGNEIKFDRNEITEMLKLGKSPCSDYEQEIKGETIRGWRMPTMREMQLMSEFLPATSWKNHPMEQNDVFFSSTWTKRIVGGEEERQDGLVSFQTTEESYENLSTLFKVFYNRNSESGERYGMIRCVKDRRTKVRRN